MQLMNSQKLAAEDADTFLGNSDRRARCQRNENTARPHRIATAVDDLHRYIRVGPPAGQASLRRHRLTLHADFVLSKSPAQRGSGGHGYDRVAETSIRRTARTLLRFHTSEASG